MKNEEQSENYYDNKKINDFDWIIQPGSNCFGLALGNVRFASNLELLNRHKIGAIVSIFGDNDLVLTPTIKHFRILISDSSRENIKCFFQSSTHFIVNNIKTTNVLVHCQAGISRSTTIVAAYLMKSKNIKNQQAINMIRQKRNHICPNKGFMKQLDQYQKDLIRQKKEKSICEIM